MQAEGIRYERVAAWTMVALVHAVLAWGITRLRVPEWRGQAGTPAIDIFWIARPRMSPPVRPLAAQTPKPGPVKDAAPRDVADARVVVRTADAAATGTASSPPAAVFPGEATLPGDEAGIPFRRDPLADRATRLPGREARTFRMRPPPSLAGRIAQVGKLFGGADHETNNCRSVRDSIDELSQAGDSRVLRDALDYEKRFCR